MTAQDVKAALADLADPKRAESSAWFFRTGRTGYGSGDKFVGVSVPDQRKLAGRFRELPLTEISKLMKSAVHEHRLCGLFIATYQFERGSSRERHVLYEWYLSSLKDGRVNNWDLVDASAYKILGAYLADKSRTPLYGLAKNGALWQQRASIVATYAFIKEDDFMDTLAIAELLIGHPHDLIHKAVGWMLRETGKRDRAVEEEFLRRHYKYMPRTALRYAIEKFPEDLRQAYLEGRV